MQNYDSKTEIIKAILAQLEIANEIAASTKKILIDSPPHIGIEEQVKVLDDLKKKSIIGGFKKRTDLLLLQEPNEQYSARELQQSLSAS